MRRTTDEPLFNSLVEHHHYLAYEQAVGEHLQYLVSGVGSSLTNPRGFSAVETPATALFAMRGLFGVTRNYSCFLQLRTLALSGGSKRHYGSVPGRAGF